MNTVSKVINVLIWLLLTTLIFNYAIIWSFNVDPGIKGSLMFVIFIHMIIGINAASRKN